MPGREPPNPPPEMPAWSPRLHIRGGPSCLLRFNGLHPTTLLVAWRRPGGGGGEGRPERSRCSDPAAAAQRRPVSSRARPCAQRERLPGRPDSAAGPCEPAPPQTPRGGPSWVRAPRPIQKGGLSGKRGVCPPPRAGCAPRDTGARAPAAGEGIARSIRGQTDRQHGADKQEPMLTRGAAGYPPPQPPTLRSPPRLGSLRARQRPYLPVGRPPRRCHASPAGSAEAGASVRRPPRGAELRAAGRQGWGGSGKRGSGLAELPEAPGSWIAGLGSTDLSAALRSRFQPPPPAPDFIAAARAAGALAPPRAQAPRHQPAPRPPPGSLPPAPRPEPGAPRRRRSRRVGALGPRPGSGGLGAGSANPGSRVGGSRRKDRTIPRALLASRRRRPRRRERDPHNLFF